MAARKKAKAKAKRRKAPARKPVTRKKTAKVRKRVSRKPAVRRPVAKQEKPAARATPAPKPVSPPPQPAKPAAPPAPGEERIGVVIHYFTHLSVAVVQMESGALRVGDMIHIKGHTTDFRQRVGSMQIEHMPASEIRAGQDFGLKVIEHAREHDVVYKVQ